MLELLHESHMRAQYEFNPESAHSENVCSSLSQAMRNIVCPFRVWKFRGQMHLMSFHELMEFCHWVCVVFISGEGFWVGKASLRSWKQLALEQLEEDEQDTKHSNGQTNGQGPHTSRGQRRECDIA